MTSGGRTGTVSGVGFVLTEADQFIGIDLDNCVAGAGQLEPWAAEVITRLGSYSELSPSGRGVRIFLKGAMPGDRNRRGNVEVYSKKRYLTVTGAIIGDNKGIVENQDGLQWLSDEFLVETKPATRPPQDHVEAGSIADAALLDKMFAARNGDKLRLLWRGDWRGAGFNSQSEGDQSLCNALAFWTSKDAGRMDALFRRCDLFRPKWDITHSRGRTYGAATIEKAIEGTHEVFSDSGHDTGDPFHGEPPVEFTTAPDAPPIPLELIPEPLRGVVAAVAEAYQTPLELPLMLALGGMACAAQDKTEIYVNAGYAEYCNLYAITPLEPANNKTLILNTFKEPLDEWISAYRKKREPVIKEAERKRENLEVQIYGLRQALQGGRKKNPHFDADPDYEIILTKIAELEAELPEVPARKALFLSDATAEAVGEFLSEQGEVGAVFDSEPAFLHVLGGRYTEGQSNLDLVLKAKRREAYSYHRRGRSFHLEKPILTICVSPQPSILEDMARQPQFRDRGFSGRFWFCLPKSRLGYRQRLGVLPPDVKEFIRQRLHSVLNLDQSEGPEGNLPTRVLRLSPEAEELRLTLWDTVETQFRDGGEFETCKDWGGKFCGNVVGMAGLLHLWIEEEPLKHPISGATMRAACAIGGILAEHAQIVFDGLDTDEATTCAKHLWKWIRGNTTAEHPEFRKQPLWQAVRGRYKRAAQVDAGLEVLTERNFIQKSTTGEGRGRKAEVFTVNPLVFEGGRQ
ncbi:MAG: DUF3987 domain-containing protein [Desulfovibrio sp.]|nr:DUF3987 domain-containing protein [Desulfovibrio sp.]